MEDRKSVFMLGATGTIGSAVLVELVKRGHDVVVFGRNAPMPPPSVEFRKGDVSDAASIARAWFCGEKFDAVISCLASRTGAPDDSWAIDHRAHSLMLTAANAGGVHQWVQLSAICVQKPRLAFQHAKLAFEEELVASGIEYSIVRPTAYFKSLSGQVQRVKRGKPFLLFGDGEQTACKPISDRDLAVFIADCIDRADRRNRILPIGGPGPAITPRRQGQMLFELLGRTPRFRSVPMSFLDGVIAALDFAGRFFPQALPKAELARIGRYYATESMLFLDPVTGHYNADATPSFGSDTLQDHYRALLAGEVQSDLRDHRVFT
jgi:divinyl chlorophyllide a 8-vinyl-reductase